jgi:threonine/homoserine/homoserine lactone efflux protein
MLTQAIGAVLPAAVAVALSPIPIVAVVLMLGTPKAKTNGPAFAFGWVAGMVVVSVVVLLASRGASDPDSATATGTNWLEVGFGVVFLVMAAKQWRARPKKGEEPTMPKWMGAIDSFTPARSLLLGAALSAANPKNLVLTAAAASSIAQAGISAGQDVIAVAVFVVIGSVTVVGSVGFYVVATEKAAKPLNSIKTFMADHNNVIMMVILLVLGAKLIGDGIGAIGSH